MIKTFVLRPSNQGQKVCRRFLKGLGLAVTEASPDSDRATGHDVFMGSDLTARYRNLSTEFPGCRFLLLEPSNQENQVRNQDDRDRTLALNTFCQEVEAFFADQPERLLKVRMPSPEARVALRHFLGLEEPTALPVSVSGKAARRARRLRRRRAGTKVFCIGFHKTGTTSLERALEYLGYRVVGRKRLRNTRTIEGLFTSCCELVPRYNAFQDNPWPIFYKELDAKYPGSKFILTHRPAEAWLRSQVKHFGRKCSRMRELIYGVGCPEGHESIFLDRYQQHNAEVRAYFRHRPSDLLEIDLTAGEGWDKLCPFLGHPVPSVPFPRSNTAQDRQQRIELRSLTDAAPPRQT
ncbi:sulfotransferase family protein [Cyanobium sp. NIES-981]|uniref:sulfotransferase family protein n=1 Tax=Cyanobium sp. NIES-981 TaxID=1851505 RepID=UPI0007DDA00E|nr:sulfotransferase family protein [Cyanobium sp. NIES-981]SBO44560.1 conserved protein of unknown function [Cyanobium sp. NIES-981]